MIYDTMLYIQDTLYNLLSCIFKVIVCIYQILTGSIYSINEAANITLYTK